MHSRTSIVYGTGERVGHVECTPVHDVDGRYALHIGWNLSLIADFDELFQLCGDISAAVDDAHADLFWRLRDDGIEADGIADAAVADDDTVMEAIKND